MTKLEICTMEDTNPGRVYLYPEGAFYKAYQKSAWLLCTRIHPFKVSARPLKGLDGPLLATGTIPTSTMRGPTATTGLLPSIRTTNNAWNVNFNSDEVNRNNNNRYNGQSVRPVSAFTLGGLRSHL